MTDSINPVITSIGSNFIVGDRVIVSDVSPHIMVTGKLITLGPGLLLTSIPSMHECSQIVPFGQFKDFQFMGNGDKSIISHVDDSSGRIYVMLTALDNHSSFQRGHEDGYVNFNVDSTLMKARRSCQGMLYMQAGYDISRLITDTCEVQNFLNLSLTKQLSRILKSLFDQFMVRKDQLVNHDNKESQFLDDADEILPSNNFTFAAVRDEAHLEFENEINWGMYLIGNTTNNDIKLCIYEQLASSWFNGEGNDSSGIIRPLSRGLSGFHQPVELSTADLLNSRLHIGEIKFSHLDYIKRYLRACELSLEGSQLLQSTNEKRFSNFCSPAAPQLLTPVDICLVDMPPCGGSQEDSFQEPKQIIKITWSICLQQIIQMMKHAGTKVDSQIGTMIITTFVANTTVNCEAAIHSGSSLSWLDYVMTGISGLICVLMISSWMIKPTRYKNSSSASSTANPAKDRREDISHLMAGASVTFASMGIFFNIFNRLPTVYAVSTICTCMTLLLTALFYGSTSKYNRALGRR